MPWRFKVGVVRIYQRSKCALIYIYIRDGNKYSNIRESTEYSLISVQFYFKLSKADFDHRSMLIMQNKIVCAVVCIYCVSKLFN